MLKSERQIDKLTKITDGLIDDVMYLKQAIMKLSDAGIIVTRELIIHDSLLKDLMKTLEKDK